MRRFVAIFAVIAVAALIGFSVLKSNNKPVQEGSTFYYYPKANIYYDVEQERYVYRDSSDHQWQRGKKKSANIGSNLGEYAIINNPAKPVWKENLRHKMIYGAALYASKEVIRQRFYDDSLRGVAKPVPPLVRKKPDNGKRAEKNKVEKKKEEKSGIERFFEELFGKKDSGGKN